MRSPTPPGRSRRSPDAMMSSTKKAPHRACTDPRPEARRCLRAPSSGSGPRRRAPCRCRGRRPQTPRRIGQDDGIATVAWQRRGAVADLDSARRPFGVPLGNALGADRLRGLQHFALVACARIARCASSGRRQCRRRQIPTPRPPRRPAQARARRARAPRAALATVRSLTLSSAAALPIGRPSADLPVVAVARQRRQLRGDHGALRLRQVAALEVQRDDESDGVVALIGARRTRNARHGGGAVAVAAVEDLLLVDPDRLAHAVGAHVGDQLVEVRALEQREQVGERMKLQRLQFELVRFSFAASLPASTRNRGRSARRLIGRRPSRFSAGHSRPRPRFLPARLLPTVMPIRFSLSCVRSGRCRSRGCGGRCARKCCSTRTTL